MPVIEYTVDRTFDAKVERLFTRFKNLKPEIEKQLDSDINKAGDELVSIMKKNSHVITGAMRDSISKTKNGKSSVTVGPNVDYAIWENARGGDHSFFDKSVSEIKPKAYSLVWSGVQTVLKK